MKRLVSYESNIDNSCMEPNFNNSSMIVIDTIAFRNKAARICVTIQNLTI